jgi:hypothetical protein
LFDCLHSIDASIDGNGKTVAVWEQWRGKKSIIVGQRFQADHTKLGSSFQVSTRSVPDDEFYPNVLLINNKILTVWEESGIQGNILNYDGISSINGESQKSGKNVSYILYPAYPNPFNPSTTIKFEINRLSDVKLSIYNILGEEINTLIQGRLSAGMYSKAWDGNNLAGSLVPTGVYIIRLTVDNNSSVQKAVFLK